MPRPYHQARMSPTPWETASSLPDTHHGLITRRSAQASHQHQELLFPRCGADRGPPGGLGVLQDLRLQGEGQPSPHEKVGNALCPPCESSRQQGTPVQLVLALSMPGPPDLAHPATTTPPQRPSSVSLGPNPGRTAGRGWL